MTKTDDTDKALDDLFAAERTRRKIHDALSERPKEKVMPALKAAVTAALAESDEGEATLRLVRIADLAGEFEGADVADLLIDVLGAEHPEARAAAGEQLEELAYDRFKEVAQAVERALDRLPVGSPALPELPYLLAEIPEPGVAKLLVRFLEHKDADAVAAAIEALADIGDPSAIKSLERLTADARTVEIGEPGSDEVDEVSIGDLALEAIDLLKGVEEGAPVGDPH